MATVELDAAVAPLDEESVDELVGGEMEKFERESRERSREPTAEPLSRVGTSSEKTMISRHTQTVGQVPELKKQSSFKQTASSIMTLNSMQNARTMTRQLRTAQRRGTVRKRSMKKSEFFKLTERNSRLL